MSNGPERTNYNSFNDGDPERPKSSGLKLQNRRTFTSEKEVVSEAEFKRGAEQAVANSKELTAKVIAAANAYVSLMKIKTTSENRTEVQREKESKIVNDLLELAVKANEDPTQPIGSGALGLESLLLRICLMQRDQINDLSYNCFKMKEILESLVSDEEW